MRLLSTLVLIASTSCAVDQPEHALRNAPEEGSGAAGAGGGFVEVAQGSSGSPAGEPAETAGSSGSSDLAPSSSEAGTEESSDAASPAPESGSVDTATPAVDHGNEYLWIDQTYHWAQNADPNIGNTGPNNWYDAKGIDYYDGKVEFRVTVTSKADATPVWHELCQWQNALGDAAHVCLHCLALYTKTGEYTCETSAPEQGGPVDYHKPFVAVQNRVKDGTSGRGTDLTTENKGLPIDYHYTVVIVPKGISFSGWSSYPIH
jgi:hypothetical protein